MLRHTPTVRTITDLEHLSPLLTCANAPVFTIEPPAGFEALSTAMAEQCTITIVYGHGWQRPIPRLITPRLMLKVHGVAYVIAYCHLSHAERTHMCLLKGFLVCVPGFGESGTPRHSWVS